MMILCMVSTLCWSAEDRPTLHIYTWQDYFDSNVLQDFQNKYDCTVALTYFVSNEDLYETLETARGDFDIITPSDYLTARLHREGYLSNLDLNKIPHIRNLDPDVCQFLDDPEMAHSIPYTRTFCGIGYNKDQVDTNLGGWDIFDTLRYRGKISMIDDMREAIGAALKSCGYSLNSTNDAELAEARAVLLRWTANLSEFIDDSEFNIVNTSNRLVNLNYNGGVAMLMMEEAYGDSIGFYIPDGGGSVVIDDFVIPKDAQQPDLAHAFINHMLDIDVARKNMESIYFYMYVPEAVAQLPAELRNNTAFNPPLEKAAQCEAIRDLGRDIEKYERIWEEVQHTYQRKK